jgi:hypothetical protein
MQLPPLVWGSARDWPLQVNNWGLLTSPAFSAGDTLSAYLYRGLDEVPLFTLACTWYTANGSQTGYGQGQLVASITSLQSSSLEPDGSYILQVWWKSAITGQSACIVRATVHVEPAASQTLETITTYNSLQDVLDIAPWVRIFQSTDTDVEGFYRQRALARQWLDWAIIDNYRGTSAGAFEYVSLLALSFGGGVGWRRSQGPSPAMVGWLAADRLILRPDVVSACAHKTASYIGLAQIGRNMMAERNGAYHREMATRILIGTTAELDLNQVGTGTIFVNLGSSNTLYT